MISDLNMLLIHYDSIVYGLTCKLYTHIVVRNQRPRSDSSRDNWRGTKDVVQVLIASTYDYIWNTCLGLSSTWMLYLTYLQLPYVLIFMWIVLSMQRPSIHPYAYHTRIPQLLLLLLLSLFYYFYYFAITTTKLLLPINCCEQDCFQVQLNWQLSW